MAKRKVCAKCHSVLENHSEKGEDKEEAKSDEAGTKTEINVPIVWILGGPGAGKSEQADNITEKYGFYRVSAGNFLVREIRSRSTLSKSLLKLIESGNLAPTDITLQGIKQEMYGNLATAKGFVIEGYPSTREQGLIFEAEIAPPTLIIFLDVPSEILVSRLMKRSRISGRDDDNEQGIKRRMKIYHDNKDNLLLEFHERIQTINANRPATDVFGDIKKCMASLVN